ncbi:MAG: hypothetical protein ACOY6E_04675 [Pseudomonadota bacterium]
MSSIFISINKSDTLEKSPIDKAIVRVAAALARQRSRLPPGPGLEVSFSAASTDWQPDFSGMRMGGYRADDPVLRFQVAVPAALGHSPRALPYVLAALEDVLDNARDYFDELRIAFDHGGWQRLLSAAARVEADPPESAWEELPLA